MKDMKGLARPSRNQINFAVPATNVFGVGSRPASRRWRVIWKQFFVCRGNPDSSGFPLASLLRNFYYADG